MEGYDVVTNDDEKVGRVVGTTEGYLVVEHGTIFKAKHAVPTDLASVDDDRREVHLTIAKDVFSDSPKVGDDFDKRVVAEYYGLGEGYEAPETEGYGELLPDDPAISAEVEGRTHGVESAVEDRVATRKSLRPEGVDPSDASPGSQIRPTSGSG